MEGIILDEGAIISHYMFPEGLQLCFAVSTCRRRSCAWPLSLAVSGVGWGLGALSTGSSETSAPARAAPLPASAIRIISFWKSLSGNRPLKSPSALKMELDKFMQR